MIIAIGSTIISLAAMNLGVGDESCLGLIFLDENKTDCLN
jgi:hypothetical protein